MVVRAQIDFFRFHGKNVNYMAKTRLAVAFLTVSVTFSSEIHVFKSSLRIGDKRW